MQGAGRHLRRGKRRARVGTSGGRAAGVAWRWPRRAQPLSGGGPGLFGLRWAVRAQPGSGGRPRPDPSAGQPAAAAAAPVGKPCRPERSSWMPSARSATQSEGLSER